MDPLVLEMLWNRLISVVNEQAAALMRTSFTSIVREAGDLSAGVFDPRGHMIAQAVTGTPGHINSMATCMHHFLAMYPVDSLRPGDVLITNDPWKTAAHLNDITVVTPIFQGDGWSRSSATPATRSTSAGGASPPMRATSTRKACSSRSSSCTTPARRTSRCSSSCAPTCARPRRCWATSTRRWPATTSAAASCCVHGRVRPGRHRGAGRRDHRALRAGDARADRRAARRRLPLRLRHRRLRRAGPHRGQRCACAATS